MKIDRFWAGVLVNAATVSLIQDCYGKEKYLAAVENGWISGWVTVPIALGILALVAFTMEKRRKYTYTITINGSGVETAGGEG